MFLIENDRIALSNWPTMKLSIGTILGIFVAIGISLADSPDRSPYVPIEAGKEFYAQHSAISVYWLPNDKGIFLLPMEQYYLEDRNCSEPLDSSCVLHVSCHRRPIPVSRHSVLFPTITDSTMCFIEVSRVERWQHDTLAIITLSELPSLFGTLVDCFVDKDDSILYLTARDVALENEEQPIPLWAFEYGSDKGIKSMKPMGFTTSINLSLDYSQLLICTADKSFDSCLDEAGCATIDFVRDRVTVLCDLPGRCLLSMRKSQEEPVFTMIQSADNSVNIWASFPNGALRRVTNLSTENVIYGMSIDSCSIEYTYRNTRDNTKRRIRVPFHELFQEAVMNDEK